MILTCSSCASRFEVNPAQLGTGGRKVRCGQCGHTWHQAPEPPLASGGEPDKITGPIPKLQEFDDARRASAESDSGEPEKAGKRSLLGPWLLFLAVLALIGTGLALGRYEIVLTIPEASRLYRLIGMEVETGRPGEGLDMRDVTHVLSLDGDQNVLLIEGTIVNISDQPRPVPGIRATITDESEQVIDSWTFQPGIETLGPGESAAFQTSTEDPPKNGNLTLSFQESPP